MTQRKQGASLVEIIIVITILVIISSVFLLITQWNRQALSNVAKTDLTARLRNSSIILSQMLAHSTQILFPSKVSNKFSNQIIFRNNENEVVVIFVNQDNQLAMYNYNQQKGRDITPYTISLKAKLAKENLLEFQIKIKKDKYEFTIADRLSTCNTLP